MANKEQKGNANNKKVAKLSLKEKRLKKQEKRSTSQRPKMAGALQKRLGPRHLRARSALLCRA